tara:strand:- start:458 stop:934 length:477 start_codon:yes stop_codon:yes gene_type:complete
MSSVSVIDDFLSEDKCDFLIDYYKKYPNKETYNATLLLWMKDTSLFDLRKSWIRNRYLSRIKKEFPLKLNYDQIVFWPPNSSKDMHKDGGTYKNNDWTSVCYLNDDYEGGYTLIEDDEFKPKKGRLVVFPSKKMNHGVSLVKSRSRYTYIAWWQEKLK